MNRFTMIVGTGTGIALLVLLMLLSWSGYGTHERIATEEEIATTERGTKYLARLEIDQFLSLLPPDSIPSIDAPEFTSAVEANEWLVPNDFVMGVRYNGIAKAYPIRILNWHEIVNDDFDGEMVVVSYNPLCNSGLVFLAPRIAGQDGELQIAQFGTSGNLYKSNLVMYDRVSFSLWSQVMSEVIIGPLVGEIGELHRIPVDLVPWGLWRDEHPDTIVLIRPTSGGIEGQAPQYLRNYDVDPYVDYRVQDPVESYQAGLEGLESEISDAEHEIAALKEKQELTLEEQEQLDALEAELDILQNQMQGIIQNGVRTSFGVPFVDDRLQAKDDVIGVVVDDSVKAYTKTAFDELSLLNDRVGETSILVVKSPAGELKFFVRQVGERALEFEFVDGDLVDLNTGSTWDFSGTVISGSGELAGAQLEEIVGVPSYWFSWVAFYPETELFRGEVEMEAPAETEAEE
ncbi:MAG: DUF3179 domain-containing (seleno)protein [Candidatus Bipolaricaulia bacterium]